MKHISSQVNIDKRALFDFTDELLDSHKLYWHQLDKEDQQQLCALLYNIQTTSDQIENIIEAHNAKAIFGLAGQFASCIRPDEKKSLSLQLAYMIEEAIYEEMADEAEAYYNKASDDIYYDQMSNLYNCDDLSHIDSIQRSRDMKAALGQKDFGGAA